MFSLNGSVNNRDVADLYSFLKKDYQLGRPQRCQLIKHLGYQGNNYWYISEKVNNSAKKCQERIGNVYVLYDFSNYDNYLYEKYCA